MELMILITEPTMELVTQYQEPMVALIMELMILITEPMTGLVTEPTTELTMELAT
ncbi:hypothetical protein [Dolosigranulum savutiense]|uniref:Uncharacterized protein n=1 Tax=Dolosigranulum savutiense TaxID=3110288 RepID=A0AB74TT34_9LACT